jgi:hypothetical protein
MQLTDAVTVLSNVSQKIILEGESEIEVPNRNIEPAIATSPRLDFTKYDS